ncbi:chemotaxis protein CheC [Salisediminibacterium halotolerans]|uniref:chemotaxis protein CheC n=1 Tax=Salisediminibacterium halotolerans TaxID=517425 RepID=UPI000EABEB0B|nr:chemotaxis protein CheC [Salisediminibacterium halotolerans]RLJ74197.1 chemotaxis protein CheC [Actinophytocola xinjiangensis]RPE87710.1 chemotaxis protein CheC [Salisediminibacterium halotolerans]TWG35034.1 chemotaxis protein CheC [Salisediminibacterium halotolerans]GEL06679.1 CheY-P phosphatase CheC [Salisediminibacterium halotolerans]
MFQYEHVTAGHLDMLKEIGNIGAGHAATALSEMLGKTIDMNVPSVRVVPFNQICDAVGGDEEPVTAVFLRIEGDAPGSMYFMMPAAEGSRLIGQLLNDSGIDFLSNEPNAMGRSALNEVGNILAGAYLSSLSDFTALNLKPTPPALAVDMAMAVLSFGLIEISKAGDYAIVIDTEISETGSDNALRTKGHFFLLPDPDSLEAVFHSLGVNENG